MRLAAVGVPGSRLMPVRVDFFLRALAWLRENYKSLGFFTERDMERAVQARIAWLMRELGSPLRVFHNHGLPTAAGGTRKADLVVLDTEDRVELAIELKYEPAHSRSGKDIWPTKFDVTSWKEIQEDVDHSGTGWRVARLGSDTPSWLTRTAITSSGPPMVSGSHGQRR